MEPRAVHVRCNQCGAALPIDLDAGVVSCGFCMSSQRMEGAAVERVRAHLADIDSLAASAEFNRSDAERYRRYRSTAWSLLVGLALNAVMVGTGWAGVLLSGWLTPRVGPVLTKLVLVPLGVVALLAILVGWVAILSRRKKKTALLPQVAIGRARCNGCGASLPVQLGLLPCCPFCKAALLPDAELMASAQAQAQAYAQAASDEARMERLRYQEKLERGMARGRLIGGFWAGLCCGSLAGMLVTSLAAYWITGRDPMAGSATVPLSGLGAGALLGALLGLRRARRSANK